METSLSSDLFRIPSDPQRCVFEGFASATTDSNYVYLTEDLICQFLQIIDDYSDVDTVIIQQDYFYASSDKWQDEFVKSLTDLLEVIASGRLQKLQRFYLKMEVFSSAAEEEFNVDQSLDSIIGVLGRCLPVNISTKIILNMNSSQHNKVFLEQLRSIPSLKELEVKFYYSDEIAVIGEGQRSLLEHFFTCISHCTHLQQLKIQIVFSNMQHNPATRGSFSREVQAMTSALGQCKSLTNVALKLPAAFFISDFVNEKAYSSSSKALRSQDNSQAQQEKSIKKSLMLLSGNTTIKSLSLRLDRQGHAQNMRRRTQQIQHLRNFLQLQVYQAIPYLVRYTS